MKILNNFTEGIIYSGVSTYPKVYVPKPSLEVVSTTSTTATIKITNPNNDIIHNVYILDFNWMKLPIQVYEGPSTDNEIVFTIDYLNPGWVYRIAVNINLGDWYDEDTGEFRWYRPIDNAWSTEGEFATLQFQDNLTELCASDFEEYVHSSLHKYFTTLRYTGYIKETETVKLLLLDVINELFSGDFAHCLKVGDMKIIDRVLNKLYGSSCLFPYSNCLHCASGNKSDDDYEYDTTNILPPVKLSYWKDSFDWKDDTIWSDKGMFI